MQSKVIDSVVFYSFYRRRVWLRLSFCLRLLSIFLDWNQRRRSLFSWWFSLCLSDSTFNYFSHRLFFSFASISHLSITLCHWRSRCDVIVRRSSMRKWADERENIRLIARCVFLWKWRKSENSVDFENKERFWAKKRRLDFCVSWSRNSICLR
jgi:hypothetical protein